MHTNSVQAVTALIAVPSRWAAGNVEARDAAGAAVEATSANAVAWSIGGAITRVIDSDADGITDAKWQRRTELEVGTNRPPGIANTWTDGDLKNDTAVASLWMP